jgi:tetratricopeptide (TPR) repeat protein
MKGELEKALNDINESISNDPYNGWAYRNKGIYYLKKQDYTSAIRVLTQAASIDEKVERVFLYLGDAHFGLKDKLKACENYKRAFDNGELNENEFSKRCR